MAIHSTPWARGALFAQLALLGAACADEAPAPRDTEAIGSSQFAIFTNGGFESGSIGSPPTDWTVQTFLNYGTAVNPTTVAQLNLQSGGTAYTYKVGGTELSQPDPQLGTNASLRFPRFGTGAAVLNTRDTSTMGSNNVNSMRQTMTLGAGDVDPLDGKIHVRFAVAPVLNNPSHPADAQPYYFVELRNLTNGTTLYQDYNASAQPGIPWKTVGSNFYTDWQLVDIAPTSTQAKFGDQMELRLIAASCAYGANTHFGRLYVDGVGSTVPGLFVSGTGPAAANAGSDITYTLAYNNGGTGSAANTQVVFNTPANTTFQTSSGGSCAGLSAGQTGALTCTLGQVDPGQSGNFTVTVRINPAATGTVTLGNYDIRATGVQPLLGPKVLTTVTQNVTYANLGITKTNGVGGVAWGQPVSYTVVASNAGPSAVSGATVTDTMPAQLTGASWTCAGAGGGTCPASGSGNINAAVNLPVGGTATFTITGNIVAGSGTGSITNTASVSLPSGSSDPDTSNNAAADTDPIGELRTINLTKIGNGQGTVVSVPAAINCANGCVSASGAFLHGSQVILSANPALGHTFAGWGGGGCTGTGNCTVTITSDLNIVANFTSPLANNGDACTAGAECGSGFCVDGVCCNTACGGGAADCQACNLSGSAGSCSPLPANTECRAANGVCDVAETCNGSSPSCPADGFAAASTECRGATGACDAAEFCTGASAACPADAVLAANTECRASNGLCDVAESCDGSSKACPNDSFVAAGTVCNPASGPCDVAELCTGASAACPVDLVVNAGVECRASNGDCDVAESCDGSSKACPNDVFLAGGTTCRAASGVCDLAELCTGSSAACPADAVASAGTQCRASNGVCDVAESCDGAAKACPSDGFVAAGTSCGAASCSGGTATLAVACTGSAASCPTAGTQSCDTYVCGPTACLDSCVDGSQCSNGNYCEGGSCVPEKPNGEACTSDLSCGSGSCVDGVCCNTACDGQCEACDVVGSVGTCTAVSGAPHGSRAACASDSSLCGGSCDGVTTTACTYPSSTTPCRDASCASGTATLAATCDGAGSCGALQQQACAPYLCGPTACAGDCTLNSDCVGDNYCSGGVCVPEKPNADACSNDFECGSGECVDGVCCNTACDGQCEACDVVGSVGTCAPVSGAPHGTRPSCATDGSLCGGSCDGALTSACTYPSVSVLCRGAACDAGVATVEAFCTGTGSCPVEQLVDCTPYLCGTDACDGDCQIDAECESGFYCAAGVCVGEKEPGEVCGAGNECASGSCVDGVCCDTACGGQCEACDVAGFEGTCTAVQGAPHGARAACADDLSGCGGTCDGNDRDACAYPGAAVVCRGAACAEGVATVEASCDGAGACPEQELVDCGEYLCGETACLGQCQLDGDCVEGFFCSGGICAPEQENGESCGGDNACASGFCVDGVCCNAACDGQCAACDVVGSVGECVASTGAPKNGRPACDGQGTCAGSCDGVSMDACSYPGSSVSCGDASCTEGRATPEATCDGAGQCGQVTASLCAPFACADTVCAESCTSESDCANGLACVDGACVPSTGEGGGGVGGGDTEEEFSFSGAGCACTVGARDEQPTGVIAALAGLALAALRRRKRAA